MTRYPVCIFCKNFSSKSNRDKKFCKAYPDGIPEKIWSGDHTHRVSFEGDNGIQYEDNGGLVELEGMKK